MSKLGIPGNVHHYVGRSDYVTAWMEAKNLDGSHRDQVILKMAYNELHGVSTKDENVPKIMGKLEEPGYQYTGLGAKNLGVVDQVGARSRRDPSHREPEAFTMDGTSMCSAMNFGEDDQSLLPSTNMDI